MSPSILGPLIATGILPRNEIDDGLAVHPLIVGTAKLPTWLALWNWMQLPASDYAAGRVALLAQLASFAIVHPGELLHIASTLLSLEEYGDPLLPAIEADLIAYIDALVVAGTLAPETDVFSILHTDGWANYGYQKKDDPVFKRIQAHMQAAVQLVHKSEMAKQAGDLLNRLAVPGGQLDLYEFDRKNGQFGGVALLQNIPVGDFADLLVKDYQFEGSLKGALHQRYEAGRGFAELVDEKSWLDDLETEVRRRASAAPAPFQKLLAQRSDYWFGAIQKNMTIIAANATS